MLHVTLLLTMMVQVGAGASADSVWHHSYVLRDVTADGAADSMSLKAVGPDMEHLVVTLEIWSEGARVYRDTWRSSLYFHYPPPGGVRAWTPEEKIAEMETRWKEFFGDSAFVSVAAAALRPAREEEVGRPAIAFELGYRPVLDSLLAAGQDSASARESARRAGWGMSEEDPRVTETWENIRGADPLTFTYFSGGESTLMIAWSPGEGRFFVIHSCC